METACSYDLNIFKNGTFTGTGQDCDGQSEVKGMMVQDGISTQHKIHWIETQYHLRSRVEMEVEGTMTMLPGSSGSDFQIQANYVTRDGSVSGNLKLHSRGTCQTSHVVGITIGSSSHNEGTNLAVIQGIPCALPNHAIPSSPSPCAVQQSEPFRQSEQLGNGRLQNYAVFGQTVPSSYVRRDL